MYSSTHVKSRAALVFALCVFTAISVFAQKRKGEKIEFSEPSSSSIVVSNLDRLETTETKIKPLPREVFRPSDFFNSQDNNMMPVRASQLSTSHGQANH